MIDALNAEGPDIDIILSEVDLPMPKGFKMLKHIMRDNALRRIPVISKSVDIFFLIINFHLFLVLNLSFFFSCSDVCSG